MDSRICVGLMCDLVLALMFNQFSEVFRILEVSDVLGLFIELIHYVYGKLPHNRPLHLQQGFQLI